MTQPPATPSYVRLSDLVGRAAPRVCFRCFGPVPVPSPAWVDCTRCPDCGHHECGTQQEGGVACRLSYDEPVVRPGRRRGRRAA
jgi:hypothetical protein